MSGPASGRPACGEKAVGDEPDRPIREKFSRKKNPREKNFREKFSAEILADFSRQKSPFPEVQFPHFIRPAPGILCPQGELRGGSRRLPLNHQHLFSPGAAFLWPPPSVELRWTELSRKPAQSARKPANGLFSPWLTLLSAPVRRNAPGASGRPRKALELASRSGFMRIASYFELQTQSAILLAGIWPSRSQRQADGAWLPWLLSQGQRRCHLCPSW